MPNDQEPFWQHLSENIETLLSLKNSYGSIGAIPATESNIKALREVNRRVHEFEKRLHIPSRSPWGPDQNTIDRIKNFLTNEWQGFSNVYVGYLLSYFDEEEYSTFGEFIHGFRDDEARSKFLRREPDFEDEWTFDIRRDDPDSALLAIDEGVEFAIETALDEGCFSWANKLRFAIEARDQIADLVSYNPSQIIRRHDKIPPAFFPETFHETYTFLHRHEIDAFRESVLAFKMGLPLATIMLLRSFFEGLFYRHLISEQDRAKISCGKKDPEWRPSMKYIMDNFETSLTDAQKHDLEKLALQMNEAIHRDVGRQNKRNYHETIALKAFESARILIKLV